MLWLPAPKRLERRFLGRLIDPVIDITHLLNPHVPFLVLHGEDLFERPMEVVRNVGYLAGDAFQRVANYSPSAVAPVPISTWNS
jgi:hypothetical protein